MESISIDLVLTVGVILPAALWLANQLRKSTTKWWTGEDENSMDFLFKDKEFIKDLTKVIEDEGGIYDFLDKVKPKLYPSTKQRIGDYDPDTMWILGGYKGIGFIQNVANKNIPVIIDKILASKSFKKYADKYKYSKREIDSFGNGLYFVLTDPSFKKNYAKMLKDVGEDVSHATREMTDKEKRKFFNLDDDKISLKSLIPNK